MSLTHREIPILQIFYLLFTLQIFNMLYPNKIVSYNSSAQETVRIR